jgi:hypothetical protein
MTSYDRGTINAFGNVKRALHIIVDDTLHAYGLFALNRKAHFPQKLALLDAAGLLPISILRRLNVERNIMEHEYTVPTRQRVEEALEVGRLLLMATKSLTRRVPRTCLVGLRGDPVRHNIIRLDADGGIIRFYDMQADPSVLRVTDGIEYVSHQGEKVKLATESYREIELRHAAVESWEIIIQKLVEMSSRAAC